MFEVRYPGTNVSSEDASDSEENKLSLYSLMQNSNVFSPKPEDASNSPDPTITALAVAMERTPADGY